MRETPGRERCPVVRACWQSRRSYFYTRQGDEKSLTLGQELATAAVQAVPWIGFVRASLGISHIGNGRFEKGLELIEQSKSLFPEGLRSGARDAYEAIGLAKRWGDSEGLL